MSFKIEFLPKFDCRIQLSKRSLVTKQSPDSLVMSVFIMLLSDKPHSKQKCAQNIIDLNTDC